MSNKVFRVILTLFIGFMSMLFYSCMFTGIEHTGHIKLSKEDEMALKTVSSEDRLMEQLQDSSIEYWRVGKSFLGASERVGLIFVSAPDNPYGKTIFYKGYEHVTTPLGKDAINVLFEDSLGRTYIYQKEKLQDTPFFTSDLPMLIDMDLVEKAGKILNGKTLWPRTRFWDSPTDYNSAITATQLLPVEIISILPGTADFPLRAVFKDNEGRRGSLVFNPSPKSSRSFSSQFYIADPRESYKNITDEVWKEICNGRLSLGMTKQEARLSMGSPDEVESGHDYSKLIEIWRYSNGTFMRFEDGLLVYFRK